ncbi:MAG: hypothetical protein EP329_24020 [Deltaproteobacteria bacterium]|nr:MAG: hypothetical protein EP329_24020 [Deltaproteobacteria bacterium]
MARFAILSSALVLAGCPVSKIGSTVDRDTADAADAEADTRDTREDTETADTLEAQDVADTVEADSAGPTCPWSDYGEELVGGPVSWVGFDPRNEAGDVAFNVAGAVLSRSTSGGATWERWSESELGFGALAFPRDEAKGIFAASGVGLLHSADGGVTFEQYALNGTGIASLMIHPKPEFAHRMFVGEHGGGIKRSDDHGEHWVGLNVGVPLMTVRSFGSPPGLPDVVVAGGILLNANLGFSSAGVLLYSGTGGLSWEVVEDGIGWADDVTFCGAETVYAAARKSVARSDDGGLTWSLVPGFAGLDVVHIAVASDCETVYAMVYTKGVYRSFDRGETAEGPFTEGLGLEPGRENANRLVVHPVDGATVFAATYAGLLVSYDSGATWATLDGGTGVAMHDLEVSDAAPGRLLGATWGTGVWRREGPEEPWQREAPAAFPRDFVYAVHADPANADRWFAASTTELWRTKDGGASYEQAGLQGSNVFDMAFLGSGTILAATQVSGVQRSTDGGTTWTPSNDGLAAFETAAGTFIDARHLVVTGDGVEYLGTNGGGLFVRDSPSASWTRLGADAGIVHVDELLVVEGTPDALYVATDAGIARSTDAGATWSIETSGLASLDINGLAVDPGTGRLYAATFADGVYWSDDGAVWKPLDRYCVPVGGFDDLVVVADDDGAWLVAVQSGGGVFRDRLR